MRAGEEGRNFYVVVDGRLNVTVPDPRDVRESGLYKTHGTNTTSYTSGHASATASFATHRVVNTLSPGDTFGEVALLHSSRAARRFRRRRRGRLWALDRVTFKRTLERGAFQRRERNENLLREVDILKGLDTYGRKILADALVSRTSIREAIS